MEQLKIRFYESDKAGRDSPNVVIWYQLGLRRQEFLFQERYLIRIAFFQKMTDS